MGLKVVLRFLLTLKFGIAGSQAGTYARPSAYFPQMTRRASQGDCVGYQAGKFAACAFSATALFRRGLFSVCFGSNRHLWLMLSLW
jgi:hypothetical protein